MSEIIGSTEITTIQEFSIESSSSVDEIDIVDEDFNVLFDEETSLYSVNITGTLVEPLSLQDKTIEEQRNDIKDLVMREFTENTIISGPFKGFLSVQDVSIPEDSDLKTIREVEISSLYVPWPKNESDIDLQELHEDLNPLGPVYEVNVISTNSPTIVGEEVEVDFEVENVGTDAGIQDLILFLSLLSLEEVDREENVELDVDGVENLLLMWDSKISGNYAEPGDYTLQVHSEDDFDDAFVTLEDDLEITSIETNSPIEEEEILQVDVTVSNFANIEITRQAYLKNFQDSQVDDEIITIDANSTDGVLLTWETEIGDAGEDNITVAVSDESETAPVEIEAKPQGAFVPFISSTNSPIDEGEVLVVDGELANEGDSTEGLVELLDFEDNVVDQDEIFVESGNSELFELRWETESGDAGVGDITVRANSGEDSETVEIESEIQPE